MLSCDELTKTHISQSMRKIYREYGWPDLDVYQKEACVRAFKLWYQQFLRLRLQQEEVSWRAHWEDRTRTLDPSSTMNT